MSNLSAADIVLTATSVNAAQFGLADAALKYKEELASTIRVATQLTAQDEMTLRRSLTFPVFLTRTNAVTHDHPLLYAYRECAREIYDRCFKVRHTAIKTLVIGTAEREIRAYASNHYIEHYFHGSDAKDYTRTLKPLLDNLVKTVRKKMKGSKYLMKAAGLKMRFANAQEVLTAHALASELPEKFHVEPVEAAQLVFEDSFYNFGERDYLELFEKTGARSAVGYGVLPMEFLFRDMPETRLYRLNRQADGKIAFTYPNGGYCNGYLHEEEKWATLLRSPVIRGDKFCLVTEIVARAGPFVVFEMIRTTLKDQIVRGLSLPDNMRYVRLLDVYASIDPTTGRVAKPYQYFSVFADEWFDALNYCLSLKPEAMTLQNTMTYVRRRGGGMSLLNSELLPAWHMPTSMYYKFSLIVYMHCKAIIGLSDDIEMVSPDVDIFREMIKAVRFVANALICVPIAPALFGAWLARQDLVGALVAYPNSELLQKERVFVKNPESVEYCAEFLEEEEELLTDCPICLKVGDKAGLQIVRCEHVPFKWTFEIGDDQLKKLTNELIDTDADPKKLAEVKEKAQASMPLSGFSHECRVYYVQGGPGCGKSVLARLVADPDRDLIYSPFLKLRPDYVKVPSDFNDPESPKISFYFQTTHRGLSARNRPVMVVEECTSMPYEYIAIAAHNASVEDVILIGDHKQTHVRAPEEGTYVFDVIDIDAISRHTLLRNFRNPPDAVDFLNRNFGYEMETMRPNAPPGFFIIGPGEEAKMPKHNYVEMAFTHATAQQCNLSEKHTVRSNQGSTHDHVIVHVKEADAARCMEPEQVCVAMSRHRHTCVVQHDGSAVAKIFLDRWFSNEPVERYKHVRSTKTKVTPPPPDSVLNLVMAHCSRPVEVEEVVEVAPDLVVEKPMEVERKPDEKRTKKPRVVKADSIARGFGDTTICFGEVAVVVEWEFAHMSPEIFETGRFDGLANRHKMCRSRIATPVYRRPFAFGSIELNPKPNLVEPPAFSHLSPDVFVRRPAMLKVTGPKSVVATTQLSVVSVGGSKVSALEAMTVVADKGKKPLMTTVRTLGPRVDYVRSDVVDDGFSDQQFIDQFSLFFPVAREHLVPKLGECSYAPKERSAHPASDSYLLLKTLVNGCAQIDTISSFNHIGSHVVPNQFAKGMLATEILSPVNQRNHPVELGSTFRSFCGGIGLTFSGKLPFQELQVLGGRYLNKKKHPPFVHDSKLLADEMVQEFAKEHLNVQPIDMQQINVVMSEFVKSCKAKSYESQFVGIDNPDARVIRFHLKDIHKPKLLAIPDTLKCGQGISAWSKDAQIMFGAIMRIVNAHFQDCLKDHFVYDNRMSPQDMKEKLRSAVALVVAVAKTGISDFEMYDSQQHEFTMSLEKALLKLLGCDEDFIEFYYSFRCNYLIQGKFVRGRASTEKTSGGPDTLLMNTVVAAITNNFLLRGDGPVAFAAKGDDGFKRQANLHVDEDRLVRLKAHTNLKMKVKIGDDAEFCGFAVVGSDLIDSIPRKLAKIASHRFKSYKHFAEYQISLRNWRKQVAAEDDIKVVCYNAKVYQTAVSEMQAMLDCIDSFSHIDEKVFEEVFELRTELACIPTAGPNGLEVRMA